MPKVSVLMTNYNTDRYIWEAIESILQQTFTDFELIILDDGSTDNSWNTILAYKKKDMRIQCYQNKKNMWISFTRNKLIDLAKWEYIAWIDSDDRSRWDRIEKQVYFLDTHPQYGIVGSWMKIIDWKWNYQNIKQLPTSDTEIKKQLYIRSSINNPSLMIRKKCFLDIWKYDENLYVAEDYDFIVRAGRKYMLGNIPEPLIEYRIHKNNITRKKYKSIIQTTLFIRRKMRSLWYKITYKDRIVYYLTWCMQFISPNIVIPLFYLLIRLLPHKTNTKT